MRSKPMFSEHENNAFMIDGSWKLVGKGVGLSARSGHWEVGAFITSRMIARRFRTSPKKKISASKKWPLHGTHGPGRIKFIQSQAVRRRTRRNNLLILSAFTPNPNPNPNPKPRTLVRSGVVVLTLSGRIDRRHGECVQCHLSYPKAPNLGNEHETVCGKKRF